MLTYGRIYAKTANPAKPGPGDYSPSVHILKFFAEKLKKKKAPFPQSGICDKRGLRRLAICWHGEYQKFKY